jgi:hypothetical protein
LNFNGLSGRAALQHAPLRVPLQHVPLRVPLRITRAPHSEGLLQQAESAHLSLYSFDLPYAVLSRLLLAAVYALPRSSCATPVSRQCLRAAAAARTAAAEKVGKRSKQQQKQSMPT